MVENIVHRDAVLLGINNYSQKRMIHYFLLDKFNSFSVNKKI
jgi:hypothetical protein